MKRCLGDRDLFNRWTGEFERCSIFEGLDEKNLDDFERIWKPALEKRAAEFPNWEKAAEGNVQDAHWDWVGKAKAEAKFDDYSVECDGMTQGLMLVARATGFGRLPEQKDRELCYVELIASAPWNRPRFSDKPKYKGTGRILMATAISLSVELGSHGRLGLHSLPESATWYSPLGFTDCGFDEKKGLQYFEMTEERAKSFFRDEEDIQ